MSERLRIGQSGDAWVLAVHVQPRASRDGILGVREGALRISLIAPPVDGEANASLVAFLAQRLGISKRQVEVIRGDTGRHKTVAVRGVTRDELEALPEG